MKKANGNKDKYLFKKVLVSSVALLVVAAMSVMYFLQYDKIKSLDKKVSNLTSQLNSSNSTRNGLSVDYLSEKSVGVKVYTPQGGSSVASTLVVMGEVPGNWSFEAIFPVELRNSADDVVAQGTAQVIGDWMTTKLVPFTVRLSWDSSESGSGTLILKKDNPSGLSENDDSVSIPVTF